MAWCRGARVGVRWRGIGWREGWLSGRWTAHRVSLVRGAEKSELAEAKHGVEGRLLRGLAAEVVHPTVPKARLENG
jgi:hypothetical protein